MLKKPIFKELAKNIKIARLCVCKKRGILSVMDMHYLLAEKNKEVINFTERHEIYIKREFI